MKYLIAAATAYLLLGLFLTRSMLRGTTLRLGFRNAVVGAISMPVITLFFILCELFEKLWARLLIVLHYDPPEILRAKPIEPDDDALNMLGMEDDDPPTPGAGPRKP